MSPRTASRVCYKCKAVAPTNLPMRETAKGMACMPCAFWLERVGMRWQNCSVRVKGHYYEIADKQDKRLRHDLARTRYKIRFIDLERPRAEPEVETEHLIAYGPIPKRFAEDLPDNARFDARG